MTLFWGSWFRRGSGERHREILIATLIASGLALFTAMGLALALPFRIRPLLAFESPGMVVPPSWQEWSAFPSDHATLFFALTTGLLRAAPGVGWIAAAHALLIVCLPRVYLGLHYPTDIVGGAVLGAFAAYGLTGEAMARRLASGPLRALRQRPGVFYAMLFVSTYLIATLFGDVRRSGIAIYRYLHAS
jgi:undecaprenyl-diphosphatase